MVKFAASRYSYRVAYSDDDQEYVGTCDEFPSLSYLHIQASKAFAGIRNLVSGVVRDMKANGEPLPERRRSHRGVE